MTKKIKKRKGSHFAVSKEAKKRIKDSQCPICGKPKSKWNRRTDWTCCSKECTKKYQDNWKSWPEIREQAMARDKYKCVKCGIGPVIEERWTNAIMNNEEIIEDIESEGRRLSWYCMIDEKKNAHMWKIMNKEEQRAIIPHTSKLAADHIMPIALGGAEFDIDNIQTLCTDCHKEKTKIDIKNIAELRKILKNNV